MIKTGLNEYTGFIITADSKLWKPRNLKFKLKDKNRFEYLMADGSLQEGSYSAADESILFFKEIRSFFIRQEPRPKLSPAELIEKVNMLEGFYVKKLTGTPSFGVLDYASARFFNFGCPNYQLLLPTYRSLRLPNYPIDNIGIQPDVYLDASVTDWVDYAIQYLEAF